MVQRTEIVLVDDIDGEPADETIQFGMDGVQYEIDLKDVHAEQLRASIEQWAEYARRIGGRRKPKPRQTVEIPSSAEVRAWAQAQGMEVSPRGRIPADVTAAFEQAVNSK